MDDCFACMCLRVLHACLVSKKVEEGAGCPGLELQRVVSYRVDSGNRTPISAGGAGALNC